MERVEIAKKLITAAGKKALQYYKAGQTEAIDKIGGLHDFYTQADAVAGQMMVTGIRRNFPSDCIEEEESGYHQGDSGYTWWVDPIDGSLLFAQNLPLWANSVGVTKDQATQFGIINVPGQKELFIGIKGEGTVRETPRGRQRIQLGQNIALERALVAVDYSKQRNAQEVHNTTENLVDQVRYTPTYGSTAFSLTHLLNGNIHGFVHHAPDRYDLGGVDVMIKEAGGVISNFDGSAIDRGRQNSLVVACNRNLHEQLLKLLNP